MNKKCNGCGIVLQNNDELKLGYTPDIKNELCQRCFKLKNYNVLVNSGVNIDNDKIVSKINAKKECVLFLVDFLNINNEVIEKFKQITTKKILVLTKCDIIPKNIKINVLVQNIKKVYDIKEDIICCSSKNKLNMNVLRNVIIDNKTVLLAGFTNAGKSSLINALCGSDITVSKSLNTTQDFIDIKFDDIKIIDAPGFIPENNLYMVPNKILKPIVYQLESKYYLNIANIKLNVKDKTNMTIYVSNEVPVLKRKEIENITTDIVIPKNSDLILKGIGFIKFKESANISLSGIEYEIRPTIIGGNHE